MWKHDTMAGTHRLQLLRDAGNSDIAAFIGDSLPDGNFERIFIKPNWVIHQEHPEFPIDALVTSGDLIRRTVIACLDKYPTVQQITVGDVPLQGCNWSLLSEQAGIRKLEEEFSGSLTPRIRFLDLRRERYRNESGFLALDDRREGDPLGYAEIVLNEASLLESISHRACSFRVADYDPNDTVSVHRQGYHHYLVSRSILDAELLINLPKMKTHQKSGITGALKNLVGINGSKAYLVHHQLGTDEFPPDIPWYIPFQVRVRDMFQKRSRWLFRGAQVMWRALKAMNRLETKGTAENLSRNFYIAAGSWHGNDSVWRMVYDLNMIALYGHRDGGPLRDTRQRTNVTIMDGLIAGEGNGPLQPLPVASGILLSATNPFVVDLVASRLMGYDFRKIRLLKNYPLFPDPAIASIDPSRIEIAIRGSETVIGLENLEPVHHFIPPPGWRGRVELENAH